MEEGWQLKFALISQIFGCVIAVDEGHIYNMLTLDREAQM